MNLVDTLVHRARQFGVKRSIAVYLVIVIGLVLACELAVEHLIGQSAASPVSPLLNAIAIAAFVGFFVFFLFQGAVEGRERASRALAESEGRFRSLTGLSADWFWETDADHRLVWIAGGQSMLALFGSSLAYGQRPWEIGGLLVEPQALAAHLKKLEARAPFHELELCRPGGENECCDFHECQQFHLISGEPRLDGEGRFAGYRGVGRDVTDKLNSARALSNAKSRLEMALEAGALATWDSDLATGQLSISEGWGEMLGDGPGAQERSVAEILERIHELDRAPALLESRRAIKGDTPSFQADFRVRTGSGGWKWIASSGKVVARDAQGRALRMTGTAMDIDRRKRAEHAMRDAEARYRMLIDLSPDAILLQSGGRIEYANRVAAEMLGVAGPAALVGRETLNMVHPDDRPMILERMRYLRNGPGKSDFLERRMLRADGSVFTVEGASVSYLERGRLVFQTVLRDISEKVRAREKLAEREQRFRDVVEAAGEYVWETDADFRYTWLSDRIEAVLGHVHADLLGRRPHDFMPLGEERTIGERLARHRSRGGPFRDVVHRSITKSGRVIWQSISGVPVFDARGVLKGYRGTGADITAKRQAEERIQYLATRDSLTGLPNRLLLADRVEQAILNAGRHTGRIAVLSVQVDRFELVTDSLGHQFGDAVLRAVADRLSNALRRDDTLARLSADEFVLLWDGTQELDDVTLVAQKVLNCLAAPIVVEERALNLSASIGIGVFPGDGRDFNELLKNADAARHAARETSGNAYRFFARELNLRAVERLEMESDLYRALANDELLLHFHPVVDARHGRVTGAEVLLRWQHPVKGLLVPDDFIPLAEQTGLMGAIGTWLIDTACAQVAAWNSEPMRDLWFALNVSTREFSRERSFAQVLRRALQSNGIAASRVSLEIAGRSVPYGGSEQLETLKEVCALGVGLTIDDFGTGQFNLAALRELPVGKLKIDRSLVSALEAGEDTVIIVQTIAAMARGLGLGFAAKGVETPAQLARLQALGCDEWQGHLYSEPLAAADFEALLSTGRRAASA